MTLFTATEDPGDEAAAGRAWLVEELERLLSEKALPTDTRWQIQIGRRETGPPGSGRGCAGALRLTVTGFLIHARDAAGTALPLSCFVPLDDTTDEDERPGASLVLSLWLDRALP
jgi:hypothetical protein